MAVNSSFYERMSPHTLNTTDDRAYEFVCRLIDEYSHYFVLICSISTVMKPLILEREEEKKLPIKLDHMRCIFNG